VTEAGRSRVRCLIHGQGTKQMERVWYLIRDEPLAGGPKRSIRFDLRASCISSKVKLIFKKKNSPKRERIAFHFL